MRFPQVVDEIGDVSALVELVEAMERAEAESDDNKVWTLIHTAAKVAARVKRELQAV